MILDVLISKYLDGDLTPQEDDTLRGLLTADPTAREAFDSAVLLHIAMRCEDESDVPSHELDAVRLMIHDRMLASPYSSSVTTPHLPVRGKGPGRSMKSMVAMLSILILAIVPISNNWIDLRPDALAVARVETMPDNREAIQRQDESISVSRGETRPPSERVDLEHVLLPEPVVAMSVTGIGQFSEAVGEQSSQEDDVASAASVPTLAVLMDQPAETIPAAVTKLRSPAADGAIERRFGASVDVILTSVIGMGVGGSEKTEEAVTQIAQSIGYGVDRKTQLGIEIGATAYSRVIEHSGLTSNAGSSIASGGGSMRALTMILERDKIQRLDPPGSQDDKIVDPVHGGGSFDDIRFTSVTQARSMWGAAFVQRTIVSTNAASVAARIGAGASQDGLIGYGRIHAEYSIFPAVSVSLGGEARMLPYRSGSAPGRGGTTAGTLFSLLYGVNVRL
jgi:hypothetical protein